jgi:tetratricopeptide (TPR) repeat protein
MESYGKLQKAPESKGLKAAWALVLLSFAFLCFPLLSFAAFEDIGVGPRPTGMGNAFVAIADDVHSIYYNPAGLGSLIGPEFTSSYARLWLGLSDGSNIGQSFIGYAQPLKRGDWGTLGLGWSLLDLSGLYREQTIYISYGRVVMRELGSGSLLAGVTFKQLSQTVSVPSNGDGTNLYNNPVDSNGGQFGGGADSVLGKTAKTATDADIGILFPFQRRYAVGLQVMHVLSPTLGAGEKLAMGEKIGFAYRGPLTKLTLELQREEGSNSQVGNTFVFGGERWINTKNVGDFAVRAGFGVGDQSFQQFSMGASYRFSKLQIDYSFTLPFNSVSGTSGHQRFALSFHFGARELAEETAGERTLRELKGLGGGVQPMSYEEKIQMTRERQEAARLYAKAQAAIQDGLFGRATALMTEAIRKDPSIPGIGEYFRRLSFVSESLPELADLQSKAHSYVYNGILDFLGERDDDATRKVAYGYSLNPKETDIGDFLDKLEKFTGIKAEKVQGAGNLSLVDQKLTESLMAFKQGQYDRVITLCQDVLGLEPENLTALNRLGSALFVMKDYPKAVEVWQKAYDLEKNEATKQLVKKYIDQAQDKIKEKAKQGLAPQPTPPQAPSPQAPQPQQPAPQPPAAPGQPPAPQPTTP